MRFSRFLIDDVPVLAAGEGDRWYPVADLLAGSSAPDDMIELLDRFPALDDEIADGLATSAARLLPDDAPSLLPFRPASLRDFMLSEAHAVNAGRGMIRRFKPRLLPIVDAYERVTRRTFPMLAPKALWYEEPIYYFSNHLNTVTDGAVIDWPPYTGALDYELELAFVVTRPLLNATPDEALAAVGGFLILNDFSARDVQLAEMRSGFGPQKAKHFVNAISPTVVTADEILPRIDNVRGEILINGDRVATTSAAGMQHSIADVLVHVSNGERIHPGEVFGLGTMPGGCGMENDRWLEPGDEIEMRIDRIGSLRNVIGPPPGR
jgi:2-keto-4-pentenoate hydratase/2-oxohepta-3-ene-1,7-dioic acid hydratase in catechol pathway